MTLLSLFFLWAMDPVRTVKLETAGNYLNGLDYGRAFLEQDGTILVRTKYQVWHFRADGSLINRIGGKGEGPAEFEMLAGVKWNGTHYWIVDGTRLISQLFNAQGEYLASYKIYYRDFERVGDDQFFAIDYSKALSHAGTYAATLQELHVTVDQDQLVVEKGDLLFSRVTARQMNMSINFKLLFVEREGDTYLVVNQIEPRMYVHDPKTRESEASHDIKKPFEAPYIDIPVASWVEPPERLDNIPRGLLMRQSWWRSWSRINDFGKLTNDRFFAAYEIPDPSEPNNSLQETILFNRKGQRLHKPLILDGYCVGSQGSELYVLRTGDKEDVFEYFIDIYDLSNLP